MSASVPWIVLATKTYDSGSASRWLSALSNASSVIVAAQNGIDHVERISPLANDATVLPALVYANVERTGPGQIVHRAGTRIACPRGPHTEHLQELLGNEILSVESVDDFHTASWLKLLGNLAVNPLTALTERRLDVLEIPRVHDLAIAIVNEAAQVARADGARIGEAEVDSVIASLGSYPATAGTSMLHDRLAGRPLEIEAMVGVVLQRAQQHSIGTPVLSALRALLLAVSE